MQNSKTKAPFSGTKEQEAKLMEVINSHKDDPGALMPVLQEAQEIYGYLPIEVQTIIAKELNKPLEEVYGVATFYSQFSLNPKGKFKVSVCLGTACYGACGLAPVMLVNEDVYGRIGPSDVEGIVNKYKA